MKKQLKFLKRLIQNLDNYRRLSKPPIAGEPTITANVTIIPKPIPTITKRMFIPKIRITQLKIDCNKIGKRFGRTL